jgi:signal recognition particle receptor subunit beta
MVVYNAGTRELTAKIVYYGPGLGGKTTNLQVLHDRLDPSTVGKLLNLATQTDRTIYFDLLPVELGDIKGYKIRFQLATVPGQTAFNETRRVVLRGADGIVFVADSQWTMLPKNLESWHNLKENLKANGVSFEGIPIVVQFNKRDLTDILSVDALQEALGLSSYPFVEAVASAGRGVTETFKLISKLTFVDLLRRLQGRRPEEAVATPPRKEPDDLLSWKDSLLSRATPAGGVAKRPLTLVPTPQEEAPFEAGAETATPSPSEVPEGPFGQSPEHPSAAVPPAPTPPAPVLTPTPEPEPLHQEKPAATPLASKPEASPEPTHRPTERIEYADPVRLAKLAAPLFPAKPRTEEISSPSAAGQSATTPPAAASASLAATAKPISGDSEARLAKSEAAMAALAARLEASEREARALYAALSEKQSSMAGRLESAERAATLRGKDHEPRLKALEDRLDSGDKRQRTAEDDVAMALRALSERGEKLHQRLETIAGQIDEIERGLSEKTNQTRREADDIRAQIDSLTSALDDKSAQGRRESEDIRTQIAPLLEAHGQNPNTHAQLLAEFDRLRTSLAESLGDLSERLRNAVRGM